MLERWVASSLSRASAALIDQTILMRQQNDVWLSWS